MKSRKRKSAIWIMIAITSFLLSGCSGSGSSGASDVFSDPIDFFTDSSNVLAVKDASLGSCPTATLGQMADAFMSGPSWSDFDSTSGGTVVEVTGDITYDGYPSTAVIQFDLTGSTFKAVYLGINGVDQNMLVLSALLSNMCDAVY